MGESQTEQSIEVNVPIRTVYNQWTQFEEFPHFMKGVEFVKQEGDNQVHWRVNIGGHIVEYYVHPVVLESYDDKRLFSVALPEAPHGGLGRSEHGLMTLLADEVRTPAPVRPKKPARKSKT